GAYKRLIEIVPSDSNAIEFCQGTFSEMEDAAGWDKSFAESQDALEKLANEALEEHRRGETRPLEEL
ncbi:MAG: hypothetical protein IIC06_09275, partial [Proteobacteria bacterium]|nr:hypothetical protein [Pseudomonadota bacterium]